MIAYWDNRRAAAESGVAVSTLARDLAAMRTREWAHRFVIGFDPANEDTAALVHFGTNFARLLQIPPHSEPPLEVRGCLPEPYPEIFLGGCRDAIAGHGAVLVQRLIDRADRGREMFRCCFIPIAAESGTAVRFVLGAYNSRSVDR
ncbi:MAG: hypothetical protein ACREDY_06540 [Bradyrhizobium sp.]